jgi:hypothetical protein
MRRPPCLLPCLALFGLILGACAPTSPGTGELELEEHALAAAPQLEPLTFQPLEGTQDQIQARHAEERKSRLVCEVNMVDGQPAIASLGEPGDLVARIVPATDDPMRSIAKVYRGEEEVFSADAGLPSPAVPLQALWTYDGHWAMEILYADADTWQGRLYVDGELTNDLKAYDEAFGFQLLGGRPFHFFTRGGSVGFSYDGQEADLGYDDVIHYRCCGESILNPQPAEDMVAFFATRDGTWYYVELGRFRP